MSRSFYVNIVESRKELTPIEKIKYKDVSDCIKLDEATKDSELVFIPVNDILISIHNEKATDPDYDNFIVVDSDGNKYVTGSKSFYNSYCDIMDELENAGVNAEEEGIKIKVYRVPSKNYKGKEFITCSLN